MFNKQTKTVHHLDVKVCTQWVKGLIVQLVHMLHLFSVQFPLLLESLPHREDQVLVVVAVVEPLLEHPLFCGQSSHA